MRHPNHSWIVVFDRGGDYDNMIRQSRHQVGVLPYTLNSSDVHQRHQSILLIGRVCRGDLDTRIYSHLGMESEGLLVKMAAGWLQHIGTGQRQGRQQ